MKLATYKHQDTVSCGIVTDDGIIDIPAHTQGGDKLHSVREILHKGQSAFEILSKVSAAARERIPLDAVRKVGGAIGRSRQLTRTRERTKNVKALPRSHCSPAS